MIKITNMSLIVSLLGLLDAIQISILTFISFLLFYTMYNKKEKRLVWSNLVNVLMLTHGLDYSLVEFNKAISLSGLCVMCLAFLPIFERDMYGLLLSGFIQLLVHTVYSIYKYYGGKNIPLFSTFIYFRRQWMKKLSIVFGFLAHVTFVLFGLLMGYSSAFLIGIVLGVLHFYFMEIDYKFVLRVRPFAYVVLPLAGVAILSALIY